MSSYLAVHHPAEAVSPSFDFWGWRVLRRLAIDYLRAVAPANGVRDASFADEVAGRLETETLREADVERLNRLLHAAGRSEVGTARDLLLQLAGWTSAAGIEIVSTWEMPPIVPDWDLIPVHRAVFTGRVAGVHKRARLPNASGVVPPYQVVWMHPDGSADKTDVLADKIGVDLFTSAAMWDWLFARRLTILCRDGMGAWPKPTLPPLLLNGHWDLSRRAL